MKFKINYNFKGGMSSTSSSIGSSSRSPETNYRDINKDDRIIMFLSNSNSNKLHLYKFTIKGKDIKDDRNWNLIENEKN